MTKTFNLMQLFSIVDGRLSYSGMSSVTQVLEHVCNTQGLMTHHLPVAYEYLKKQNPNWFIEVTEYLDNIKQSIGNDFETLMSYIECNNKEYQIPQLPEEVLTDDTFGAHMLDNSLLSTIGKNKSK